MKALTVRQLCAYAIMSLGKDIENRDWYTHFRGRVAIHAAKGMMRSEYEDARYFISNIVHGAQNRVVEIPKYEELTRGAIIGTVEIVDCVMDSDSLWFQGDYGFVLKNRKARRSGDTLSGCAQVLGCATRHRASIRGSDITPGITRRAHTLLDASSR